MFSLFAGLIGGMAWSTKALIDRDRRKEREQYSNDLHDFYKKTHNCDMQRNYERMVRDPYRADFVEQAISEVWDALPAIFPVETEEEIRQEKVAILMARQGYLTIPPMIRTCRCVEEERYHVFNLKIKETMMKQGKYIELSRPLDYDGSPMSTEAIPLLLPHNQESARRGNTMVTNSRCSSDFERVHQWRMREMIKRCPHGCDVSISPDRYGSEEEYQEAVQKAYNEWRRDPLPVVGCVHKWSWGEDGISDFECAARVYWMVTWMKLNNIGKPEGWEKDMEILREGCKERGVDFAKVEADYAARPHGKNGETY